MLGNADVHDEALARAAAAGDRDAFGTLFERHLPAVFAAAWLVLHDRAVAAEIARDTFIGAWKHAAAVTPVAFSDSLVASAVHKAHAWLDENPQGLEVANAPITDDPPSIGPVLRARIVTALEVQGIPTKPQGQAPAGQALDLGPSRSTRGGLKQRLDGAFGGPRARLAILFGTPRARLGIVGAAAAVLVVGGVVVISGDAGGSSPDDDIETAASDRPDDDDAEDPRDLEWQPVPDDVTTTSTSASSTSSSSSSTASSATSEATTPTQPVRSRPTTSVTSPPATPAPTAPPTQPTSPPTTAQPTVPTILEFTGSISGKCENGQDRLVMSWKTVQSTWVWVHTEGAVWEDVSGPNGSTSRCTTKGTKWYLEIRRDGDWLEDTATLYA